MSQRDYAAMKKSAPWLIMSIIFAGSMLKFNMLDKAKEKTMISTEKVPDLVIDALKDNHTVYLANEWATIGFLIIAIGWVISSDKARLFWSSSEKARYVCLNAVTVLMVFHCFILFDAAFESERILANIQGEIPGAQYFAINRLLAFASSIVDGVLFILLWLLIANQTTSECLVKD